MELHVLQLDNEMSGCVLDVVRWRGNERGEPLQQEAEETSVRYVL